jgi:hypothetical protein
MPRNVPPEAEMDSKLTIRSRAGEIYGTLVTSTVIPSLSRNLALPKHSFAKGQIPRLRSK